MQSLRRMLRRRYVRGTHSANRKNRQRIAKLIIALGIIFALCFIAYARMTPLICEIAVTASKNAVTTAVNKAIEEHIAAGEFDYSKLITLEKDTNGNVSAIITDMARINTLKARLSDDIMSSISNGKTAKIGIPLGNLIGGTLLSGMGPEIPVRIVSAGALSTDFTNNFSSAGINQTRHQILIEVNVRVLVLIPGSTMETDVKTQITVAETVIIGSVPESYLHFGTETQDTSIFKDFYSN